MSAEDDGLLAVSPDGSSALPLTPSSTSQNGSDDQLAVVLALRSTQPSRLSPRDQAILTDVALFRQLSTHHLQRLHFDTGSEALRGTRTRKVMARLHRWGLVERVGEQTKGGMGGGSNPYVYAPPGSKARGPNYHTLDISELYVSLVEVSRLSVLTLRSFDPEPYSHLQLGTLEVKPDARIHVETKTGQYLYYLELDRSSEWRTQLSAKMRRFVLAYQRWPQGKTFPKVLFVVHDEQRLRFVQTVARRQPVPLFEVILYQDTLKRLAE